MSTNIKPHDWTPEDDLPFFQKQLVIARKLWFEGLSLLVAVALIAALVFSIDLALAAYKSQSDVSRATTRLQELAR